MLTRYQKFKIVRFRRSEINFAHYNPRKIGPEAKKKLRKNIKDDAGLIETVVVNTTTMNLVSGHQRLTILDELEKYNPETKENDYELDGAAVEMTEEQERKQNIFMNNREAQGEYDADLLQDMLLLVPVEDFGMSDAELAILGVPVESANAGPVNDKYFDELFTKKTGTKEQREENKNNVKEMKQQITEKAAQKAADTALSYFVMNFPDFKSKKAFMQRFDLDPAQTFIDGLEFSEMVERIYD